jgi:hypothetical protein
LCVSIDMPIISRLVILPCPSEVDRTAIRVTNSSSFREARSASACSAKREALLLCSAVPVYRAFARPADQRTAMRAGNTCSLANKRNARPPFRPFLTPRNDSNACSALLGQGVLIRLMQPRIAFEILAFLPRSSFLSLVLPPSCFARAPWFGRRAPELAD